MALAAEAQAVAMAEHGPFKPQRMEIWPLAALTISLGIDERADPRRPLLHHHGVLGLKLVEPADSRPDNHAALLGWQSWKNRSLHPRRPRWPAARANCANRSRCRASLTPKRATGSQSWTWPPKWTLNSVVSKRVSGPTPLRPAQSADQNRSRRSPSDVTTPMPVMTTRRGCAMILLIVKSLSLVDCSERSLSPGFPTNRRTVTWRGRAVRCNRLPGRLFGSSPPPRRGW